MCEQPDAPTQPGVTLRAPLRPALALSQRCACESWRTQELQLCFVPTPRFPQSYTSGTLERPLSVEGHRTNGLRVGGVCWFHLLIDFLHVGFPFSL